MDYLLPLSDLAKKYYSILIDTPVTKSWLGYSLNNKLQYTWVHILIYMSAYLSKGTQEMNWAQDLAFKFLIVSYEVPCIEGCKSQQHSSDGWVYSPPPPPRQVLLLLCIIYIKCSQFGRKSDVLSGEFNLYFLMRFSYSLDVHWIFRIIFSWLHVITSSFILF